MGSMSYKATNWAYDMKITGPAKPVLVALADMADEEASCFPGQDRLAEMTGLSVSTVGRALRRLEALGLLIREHRYGAMGYRTSDRYRLVLAVSMPETLPVTEPTGRRALRAVSRVLPVTVQSPTGQSDRAEENHQYEPSENHQGGAQGAEPPQFCGKHPQGTETKCGACGDARRLHAKWLRDEKKKPTPTTPLHLPQDDGHVHTKHVTEDYCTICEKVGVA